MFNLCVEYSLPGWTSMHSSIYFLRCNCFVAFWMQACTIQTCPVDAATDTTLHKNGAEFNLFYARKYGSPNVAVMWIGQHSKRLLLLLSCGSLLWKPSKLVAICLKADAISIYSRKLVYLESFSLLILLLCTIQLVRFGHMYGGCQLYVWCFMHMILSSNLL